MRLKVTPENCEPKKLENALDEFARMSDDTYRKTAAKWQKRADSISVLGSPAGKFPDLAFEWLLDESDKNSRIFFVSAKTPTLWKFFKLPQKKMESELKAYLLDVHKIRASVKYQGD
jgi:hypothetical protein